MTTVNLNAGMTVQQLLADTDLDEQAVADITEKAKDGFDEEEMTEIKANYGEDISKLIIDNSTEAEGADGKDAEGTDEKTGKMAELTAKKNGLIKERDDKIKEKEDLEKERNAKIKDREGKLGELAGYQQQYEAKMDEIEDNAEKYEELKSAIDEAAQDIKDDTKKKLRRATLKAMAEYSKEEDGDWNKYLGKKLKGIAPDSTLVGYVGRLGNKVQSLASEISSLQSELSGIVRDIKDTETEISNLDLSINSLQSLMDDCDKVIGVKNVEIGKVEEEIRNLDPTELLRGMVDDVELCIVKEQNIDLKEKLSDGSPRYLIAQGAIDGKFHIYDMGDPTSSNENGTTYYKSLVRQYSPGMGFDIIECGNGWISKIDNAGTDVRDKDASWYSGASGSVFHINDCNELEGETACYSTASPLSFDIDGNNKIETSSTKRVSFDIDGDGDLDEIDDSADAVLVFNADGDDVSGEDGGECFGNNTHLDLDGDGKWDDFANGFEALAALARHEGLINDKDDMKLDADDLKVLQDKWGLGMKLNGYGSETSNFFNEDGSINEAVGITEINLSNAAATTEENFDGRGNALTSQEGATFVRNGETRIYADIWHAYEGQNDNPDKDVNFVNKNAEGNKSSGLSFDMKEHENTYTKYQSGEDQVNRTIEQISRDTEEALEEAKNLTKKPRR